MDTARDNLIWASTLVGSLAVCGVEHAVVSPGSRSTPLTLACLRHPRLKTWVCVDERSAAFFALGLAKSSKQPVILICTSGSAPAHWFPALIEADQGATPLILLTADRPPELRGCGANQAIDQIGLFGHHVRAFHELPPADASPEMLRYLRALASRVADQCRWPVAGPVHVNVPLREPLVPTAPCPEADFPPAATISYPVLTLPEGELENLARELAAGRGMIVCGDGVHGDDFPDAVTELAWKLACPILADPLSQLRFGSHDLSAVLSRYDAFLRRAGALETLRPDWVLRFGAMPVSKSLQRFLDAPSGAAQWVVDGAGRWPDPLHRAARMLRADPAALCRQLSARAGQGAPSSWHAAFAAEEHRAAQLALMSPPLEAEVVRAVIEQISPGSTLFSGNSMAVRDLDAYSGCGGKALHIVGNRGASGIDGNVSTALGLAAGSGRPVLALLGDLAFYHDMNGLAAVRALDVVFVVLNNGGGGIFSYLPQAELDEFERAWLTPLDLDFSHAAAMYGLSYRRVGTAEEFSLALEAALNGGAHLVEVMLDRATSVSRHQAYWVAVAGS